jgi:hypothetical protein
MRTARSVLPAAPLLAAGLLLLSIMAAGPAPASAAGRQELRYQIEVAGVQVGEIEVAAQQGARTARARVGWAMDGLFGMLERGEGTLEGRGRVGDGGLVAPALFQGRSEKPDREREVVIRYGEDGAISSLRLTNNGERRKSGVPEDLRQDTVDTLTAFWRLRRWAVAETDGHGEEPLVVSVFDGRRRYDLHARRLGRERAERDGREVEAVRIELRLVPRAGFDEDGRVFGSTVDPDRPWAEVLVSAGEDPVPLVATGTGRLAWRIVLAE